MCAVVVIRGGPAQRRTGRLPTSCCGRAGSSPGGRPRRTCGRSSGAAVGRVTSSTATGGATTRSSGRPTASTAPAPARGRCTSRTGSSPGRLSRPTTRRWARTPRSTSRAAARVARRSRGTPTRPPGCATRTLAASFSTCTARRSSGSVTRCWPGRTSSVIPNAGAATSGLAARAATYGCRGTRRSSWSLPLTCTRSRRTAPTASRASPRSRRCRWSPTRWAHDSSSSSADA